ncbi:MAG: glycoside hydrolase family 5 protein [Deltaproteobacteria bacterium]|nr:glycoside hydrolase family 5 protein [Deltaproteobacteria bacterium]
MTILLLLFILFSQSCKKDDLANIIRVDYEGRAIEDIPQIRIVTGSGTNYQISQSTFNNGNAIQLESDQPQFISIVAAEGDLVTHGNGVMLSMWIRGELASDSSEVRILSNSLDKNGETETKIIGTGKLSGTKWSWLAAWYYRGEETAVAESFILEIDHTAKIVADDILMTYTPEQLPEDLRPLITVDKDRIMDGDKQISLQGVNLSAYSSPRHNDLQGHELTNSREDDYRDIKARGWNVIRLNLNYEELTELGGWKWMDIQILWARRHDLRLILDLHSPPGGYQCPDYDGDYWKDTEIAKEWRDQTMQFWKEASQRYRDNPTIAAFNLINEPRPDFDAQWWAFVRKAVKLVRAEGFQQPITVESTSAADARFELVEDDAIIYDYHFYDPWFFASAESGQYNTACLPHEEGVILNKDWQLKSLKAGILDFAQEHEVPVNIGEYGFILAAFEIGGELWLQDLTDILDEYHISRQYWCWQSYTVWALDRSGWNRNYPPEYDERILSIISKKNENLTW